ncbi:hypothetical protein [Lacticaseibacillus hulanensis]|uniref:hypothetical protein n=1 Tax=Lacticaseibacillus hulanensis TaxID=2493111 RepID=UPI000FDA13A4|nr:hypothetical protein [Lacticaseibacillus hulanensis]
MNNQAKMLKLFSDFKQTDEYAALLDHYPEALVNKVVLSVDEMMAAMFGRQMAGWQGQDIYDYLGSLVEQADADGDPEAQSLLIAMYDVLRAFFRFLARKHKISLSSADMEDLLDQFENESGLGGVEQPKIKLRTDAVNMDPNLPEWRDNITADNQRYVGAWLDSYFKSSRWTKRDKRLSKDVLSTAVLTITEKVYDLYRKTPKTWTKTALRGVMCNYLVKNVDFDNDEYPLIVPGLVDFIGYVAQRGCLNSQRAANYQRYLRAIEPEMIDAASDALNQETGVPASGDEDELTDDDLREILNNPEKFATHFRDYDQDPGQHYLLQGHLPYRGAQKWSRKTAITVHQQAVSFGLCVWMLAQDVVVASGYDEKTAIAIICETMDVMYAQHLETPDSWQPESWREFGDWLRNYSKQNNRGQRQAAILAAMVEMLGDKGIIDRQRAAKLKAAVLGEKIPSQKAPTKVSGKVISLKQARKMLKNKRV